MSALGLRFLPAGSRGLLVELAGLEETLSLFESLQRHPIDGVEELVPAARTVLIRFLPEIVARAALRRDVAGRELTDRTETSGALVEIPVRYDGEDLDEVAQILGVDAEEVVRRHTECEYTVAFTGFAPGFAYLAGDAGLDVPRRKTPRTRIPAGAVGLAGEFSGVYPQASPGGWQIIGTTQVKMFDLDRDPPSVLQPGLRVRFVDLAKQPDAATSGPPAAEAGAEDAGLAPGFVVRSAGLPALLQDLGRPGQARLGVAPSGAADRGSLRAANRALGNPAGAACLEITLGAFSFEAAVQAVVALAGAACPVTVKTSQGRTLEIDADRPFALEPGDRVTLGAPKSGIRTYLAVRGGFDVAPVLGGASTDTLARIGPDPVEPGQTLRIGAAPAAAVSDCAMPALDLPSAGDVVTLDVVMGPRSDWFTSAALEALSEQEWIVTPQSSRVGVRLEGEVPLERAIERELPSEGTVTGSIQVPASGQPVLFLADRPLTGGYPVIACVADSHLDLAGQIPVGARIRFNPLAPFDEISEA